MLLTNQMIWEVYRISKPTATRWADATFCHRAIGMFYPCTVGAPLAQNLEKGYVPTECLITISLWISIDYFIPIIFRILVGGTVAELSLWRWSSAECLATAGPWTGWELNGTPSPSARRKPTRTATAAKNSTGEPNSSRLSQLFEAVYN